MPVKFDLHTYTDKEKDDLDRYFRNHPEIQAGQALFKMEKINPDSPELPPGTMATVEKTTKITPSLMPRQLAGIASLYELAPLSEIGLLGNRPKLEQNIQRFFKTLGKGPTLDSIGLAISGHLPKDRGHDLAPWSPTLGTDGYVSILTTNEIGQEPKQYLFVSVPHLQFALDALSKFPIMSVSEIAAHEDYRTIRTVAERNADKIASAFSQTLGVELRHRKFDIGTDSKESVGSPVAVTFAETLKRNDDGLAICSNIGHAKNTSTKFTIRPISPKVGAVLTQSISDEPIEMPYTSRNAPIKSKQEIGTVFLNDRVFSASGLKSDPPSVLKHDKHTHVTASSFAQQKTGILLHPIMLVVNE